MPRFRTLIVHLPRLSREIIAKVLAAAPDLEVIEVSEELGPVEAVVLTRADVVVVGVEGSGSDELAGRLLRARPRVMVLELSTDGRRAWLTGPGSRRRALDEVSAESVIGAIREGAGRGAGVMSKE